eukprot:TRINITY_DN4527_c0_g2_i5.p1 TRINITY_DN4527_c0_g2~~TRINITY_DN4527_c0_g2_i5.p1  ORF type:complete len:309 (-),score=39.16 TRINITY_DN4527_c0_g2_i5:170-1096(-)
MIVARLLVALLIPFGLVLIFNQQCNAFWLRLWGPCSHDRQFDISAELPYKAIAFETGFVLPKNTFQAISHDAVCRPGYRAYGECPRAVVDSLGKLIVDKMLFVACVGPVRSLLINTARVRAAIEWVAHKILRRPNYRVSTSLDAETAGVLMIMELVLVFGFAVPVLLPITVMSFLLHAVAFQVNINSQGTTFEREDQHPVEYLWFSLLLGAGLTAWMFAECEWVGRILVLAGMPVCAVLGVLVAEVVSRMFGTEQDTAEQLALSLLDESDDHDDHGEADSGGHWAVDPRVKNALRSARLEIEQGQMGL